MIGTIIGCAVGRGAGCAIGAGAGVAAGTAASAASPGPRVWIPAEALVTFHLMSPLTVDPVSAQEAARLAQGLYPGGPSALPARLLRAYGYGPYPTPIRRFTTGRTTWLAGTTTGGNKRTGQGTRKQTGIRRCGCPLCVVACAVTQRAGRSSMSSVAVLYNEQSRIERELRIRGRCRACTDPIAVARPRA